MKKWLILGIVVILIAVASLSIYNIIRQTLNHRYEPMEFSQELWDSKVDDRGRMTDDLLEKYDFATMQKDEVIELLGRKKLRISKDTLVYETNGGFFKDELLIFLFNEDGKIIEFGIGN